MNSDKIQRTHQERAAIIYVRQSSMDQVRHNLESKRRQYELAQLATRLGFASVTVIDEDQGRSGSGSVERTGFLRLLDLVFQGQVGAVFALEASRLARNNRDWHHLVDLCAMAETLVIDHDGVYDPRLLNDRLLLGLKGTMSEFELGLFRQRAKEAFLAKVKRGVVMTRCPPDMCAPRMIESRCIRIVVCKRLFAEFSSCLSNWAALAKSCSIIRKSTWICPPNTWAS
jgi:DNA invertase Pin-like site-specific DNA recombinase